MNNAARALARLVDNEESTIRDALHRAGENTLADRISSLVNGAEFTGDEDDVLRDILKCSGSGALDLRDSHGQHWGHCFRCGRDVRLTDTDAGRALVDHDEFGAKI